MAVSGAETCRRHTIYCVLIYTYDTPKRLQSFVGFIAIRYQPGYAYDLGHVIRYFGTVFDALQCIEQSFLFRIRGGFMACSVAHGTHCGTFSFRNDKQKVMSLRNLKISRVHFEFSVHIYIYIYIYINTYIYFEHTKAVLICVTHCN